MDRIKVTVERTNSDGQTAVLDSFVYELPMTPEQTANVSESVLKKLETLSAAASANRRAR